MMFVGLAVFAKKSKSSDRGRLDHTARQISLFFQIFRDVAPWHSLLLVKNRFCAVSTYGKKNRWPGPEMVTLHRSFFQKGFWARASKFGGDPKMRSLHSPHSTISCIFSANTCSIRVNVLHRLTYTTVHKHSKTRQKHCSARCVQRKDFGASQNRKM